MIQKETNPIENMTLGIIGVGVMGSTIISALLDKKLVPKENFFGAVHTLHSKNKVQKRLGIEMMLGFGPNIIKKIDIFLVCVKPYRTLEILKELKDSGRMKESALVISVAAGVTLKSMEEILGNRPIIRAMPNTPCLVGAGMTVTSPGRKAKEEHLELANQIFSAVGKCIQLEERHMDAVTAVSGSGPAYIYLMMEALADGALRVGLPRDVAFQLVSQTMMGAALMMQDTGKHPATLKDAVTTPAGCTISALLTMEDGRIRSTLARAVEEATKTAASLG